MKKRLVLTDCDDVLLDWLQGFRQFCQLEKGIVFKTHAPDDWNMAGWIGVPEHVVGEWIHEFNNGAWEFGALPAFPDAIEGVSLIADAGYRLVCVTSCSADISVVKLRRANLFLHFGDVFDDVICLDVGVSKKDVLARFEPTLWVEDNYQNGRMGLDCGHRVAMIRRNHNRRHETSCDGRVSWHDNWLSIVADMLYGNKAA